MTLREEVEETLLQRAMTCTIVTFCRRTKKLTMLLMLLIDEGTGRAPILAKNVGNNAR